MATTDAPRRLTPKIRDLVAPDRLDRPEVGRLTRAQVETLTAVATDPRAFAERVSVRHALHALAVGTRAQVSVPILDRVLGQREVPEADRVVAARELGRIATADAEAALTRHVRDRNPRVQQAVLAGLGTFAGPGALRDLAKLTAPADPATRRQLVLARALIAHRHGLDGPFLPEVPPMERQAPPEEPVPVTMRVRTPKATATDRERFHGPTYGIDLGDRAYGLRCGRSEWTVFLNRDIAGDAKALDAVFTRPFIAAVVARWYSGRLGATTQYVVLTRPTEGGARIEVVRGDGDVVYAGTARRAERAIAFTVSDVERAASAPTLVSGRLRARSVDLETAFSTSRTATRSTAAVEP